MHVFQFFRVIDRSPDRVDAPPLLIQKSDDRIPDVPECEGLPQPNGIKCGEQNDQQGQGDGRICVISPFYPPLLVSAPYNDIRKHKHAYTDEGVSLPRQHAQPSIYLKHGQLNERAVPGREGG